MARTVRDASLESRSARLRLAPQGRPYWRLLEFGLHLGYRRLREGSGTWVARRASGTGAYSHHRLGAADDFQDADADQVLTFAQAQEQARAWWKAEGRKDRGLGPDDGPYTIEQACKDYLAHYVAKGGKSEYTVKLAINVHIIPALGKLELAKLTTRRVRDWHHGLAAAPKRLRTGSRAKERNQLAVDPNDADAVRSRRSTANRILTTLKAVLNHAYHERMIEGDEAWRPVKPFRGVDIPRIRYLSADECRRLVNACAPDIRRMVHAAILTGARYGELTRLRCEDVHLDSGAISIREAKGGQPRHAVLTDEAAALFKQLVAGKGRRELVFVRDDGNPWKAAQQTRPISEACKRAGIEPAIGFHVLRHTHGSTLAMKGVPMGVIAAQLGHADTRITERHYAHLAPNYVTDTIRAAFPSLNLVGESNLVPLNPGAVA
jgi:integrase